MEPVFAIYASKFGLCYEKRYTLHQDIYYAYLMNFVLRRYFYDALYIICFNISNESTEIRVVFKQFYFTC